MATSAPSTKMAPFSNFCRAMTASSLGKKKALAVRSREGKRARQGQSEARANASRDCDQSDGEDSFTSVAYAFSQTAENSGSDVSMRLADTLFTPVTMLAMMVDSFAGSSHPAST